MIIKPTVIRHRIKCQSKCNDVEIKKTKAAERNQKWREILANRKSEAEKEKKINNLSEPQKIIRCEK